MPKNMSQMGKGYDDDEMQQKWVLLEQNSND